MPAPIESAYFRAQRPCLHALKSVLDAEILALTNGTAGAYANLPKPKETKVRQLEQSMDIAAPSAKIQARELAKTGWSLFISDSTTPNTKVLVAVGKFLETGGLFAYYDWVLSDDDRVALNGEWDPGELDNSVDHAYVGTLKYAHADKHFNAKKVDEAQYTIGTSVEQRKRLVAGMEEKAIAHGFGSGERFFQFDEVVGNDPKNTTRCIRVDTPGGASQHSHPIPESGAGEVNHDDKVVKMVAYHTRERQLDELVKLAKYLRLIGARENNYTNLKRLDASMWGGLRPPSSRYWRWN